MEKKHLIEEKEEIFKEVIRLRDELKATNDMINDIGGSVSFINFVLIPIVVAVIVAIITYFINVNTNQRVGSILIAFIISFVVSTIANRERVADRKRDLVEKRVRLQRELAALGKRLSEIENEINS